MLNFVRYILRSLFTDSSTWLFRIEYIVTYHTYLALNDLKNHSDNNNDISLEKNSIEEILEFGKPLFQSKFRNCMMHYDLAGYDVLSREYIKCPFYGIVETCFEGKDYHSYLAELRNLSDMIIDYLENRFDFSDFYSLKFSCKYKYNYLRGYPKAVPAKLYGVWK